MTQQTHGPGPLPAFFDERPGDVVPIVTPVGDKMWLVRGYALGRLVLADARFSRAEAVRPGAPRLNDAQPVPDSMMSMDGSEHARLRRIVAGTFTTGRVAAMAPFIERVADRRLDAVAAAGPGADLMETLAVPLPLEVICSLLGVPPTDGDLFRTWVEVLFDISASSPRQKARHRLELTRYMAKLIERKRSEPGEDLITALIERHGRAELSMPELVTMGLSLLMAGYETTVGQIGLSVLLLLGEPALRDDLRAGPAAAVEELLRRTPSTPLSFPRVAREAVVLGDVTVQPGEGVLVSLLDANQDPAVTQGRPGAHLTFGHGPHRCPGAPLARLQVQIAVERLLSRFPQLRLAAGEQPVIWKEGLATRGLSRLAVEWQNRPTAQ
ncbi:cytochrome P450 [Actinoplanes sp. NPDC026619]|uniref:cytochrome P450 n=1 Tax=Actinoplanes sp. NPDC026619 TaxID=3155798 RepID=UPI0033EB10DC